MRIFWEKAPERVVELAKEVIEAHHPGLKRARIGLLFRSKGTSSGGRTVIGKAATVNDQWKAILGDVGKLDFIIWFAQDWWDEASLAQRKALVDHELCHCTWNEKGRPAMRGHDIEEFDEIIARHGIWKEHLTRTARAFQPHFQDLESGEVVALKPNGHRSFAEHLAEAAAEEWGDDPDVEVSVNGERVA